MKEPKNVCFSVLKMVSRDIFYLICNPDPFFFLEMLPFMNIYFPFISPSLPQDTTLPNFDDVFFSQPSAPNPTLQTSSPLLIRQVSRPRRPPSYLQDYHYQLQSAVNIPSVPTLSYPHTLSSVLFYDHLSSAYKHFTLSITVHPEPKIYNEAIKNECWKQAMQAEIPALE